MIGGVFSSAHSQHPGWETIFDYRQYLDHQNFADSNYACDRTVINVGATTTKPQSFRLAMWPETNKLSKDARAVSIAYLYWLQTAAPRDDGNGQGYPNLMVREDIFGRADGTAPQAYIRESRRIAKPIVRLLEQHIALADPGSPAKRAPGEFLRLLWDMHVRYRYSRMLRSSRDPMGGRAGRETVSDSSGKFDTDRRDEFNYRVQEHWRNALNERRVPCASGRVDDRGGRRRTRRLLRRSRRATWTSPCERIPRCGTPTSPSRTGRADLLVGRFGLYARPKDVCGGQLTWRARLS